MFFDSTMLLIIPAALLSLWAQGRVNRTFNKFRTIQASRGVTADSVARRLLDSFGLNSVPINEVDGELSDHYNPMDRTLNLSQSVYGDRSIAAIGVAAHEVGHAIQHSTFYFPLMFRNNIVPVTNLVSGASGPVFFAGLLFGSNMLMDIGILLFVGVLVFHIVTLPVEFNASSRAIKLLNDTNTLTQEELSGAKQVLNAAAWTYIAAAFMTVMQLMRLVLLRNSRNRD